MTIQHKYGSTTIEQPPERVVVVGLRDQDALLALGIVPVATTEWFGDHPARPSRGPTTSSATPRSRPC